MGAGDAIGIFDSGVGGLTVLHALAETLPAERLFYLGDAGRHPYGTKSGETVARYSLENAEFLLEKGIKLLVVACNTASAVALDALRERCAVPVVGVIEPGARAAAARTRNQRVGVIGTDATIASGAYTHALRALRPGLEIYTRPCPLLVPLAEEGWVEGPIARGVVETYLGTLRHSGIDTLVLGCTHYPLLKPLVEEVNGLEESFRALPDSAFAEKTAGFRERLAEAGDEDAAATLEEILPEAFAAVREASRRTIGLRHFDVQLLGGIVLHEGRIAEMKTGEGKTLVATLPLYLNALRGKGSHLVTVNDYLARRDVQWMGPIYSFLGLTVTSIIHDASFQFDLTYIPKHYRLLHLLPIERRDAYRADIPYG